MSVVQAWSRVRVVYTRASSKWEEDGIQNKAVVAKRIREAGYESTGLVQGVSRDAHASVQTQMLLEAAADEAQVSVESVRRGVEQLCLLIPGLGTRLSTMKKSHIGTLAMSTEHVVSLMLVLSEVFPTANVGTLCCKRPDVLVEMDAAAIREAASTLRSLLGEHVTDIDYLVEQEPLFLHTKAVKEAVRTYLRIFPDGNLSFLQQDPSQILTWQSRVGA